MCVVGGTAVLSLASCHVTDVTAPIAPPDVQIAFTGDGQIVAGTRKVVVVNVTSGTTPVTDARIRLTSSDTTIVAISSRGDSLVALRLGTAKITAAIENSLFPENPPSASRAITVVPRTFAIVPGLLQFLAIGDTATLTADARDAAGNSLQEVTASWRLARIADSLIVRLNGRRLTAAGAGVADVLAIIGNDTARASVSVAQRLTHYSIAGGSVTLDALSAESTLVFTALDANGFVIAGNVPLPIWESADTTTATVDGAGRVRAVRNGTTYVRARRADGGADSTMLVVDQRAVRVAILPPARLTLGTRDTITLDAISTDRLGNRVTDAVPRWSSSMPSLIDFGQGAAGNRVLLNSYAPGLSVITAVLDGQRDSVTLRVVNEPALIRLTPDSTTIDAARDSAQLSARVYNASGDTIANSPVTWSTPDTLVVRAATPGWFVAVDSGRARVIARTTASNGVLLADTSIVQVTNAPRVVRMLAPADTLTFIGAQWVVPIEILNALNAPLPRTRVHWESRDQTIASVSSVGQVTANASGATWIVAWSDLARDSTRLIVDNRAASVTIDNIADGAVDTLPLLGDAIRYTATVRSDAGAVVTDFPLTWTSSASSVATVQNGLVTAVGFGTVNIIVRAANVADTVRVVVRRPTHWHVDGVRAGLDRLGTFARPFADITAAVNSSSAGDTIVVAPGTTYRENLIVTKPLTIAGDSAAFLASGRNPQQLPAIVNAAGTDAIRIGAGAGSLQLRHMVIRHSSAGAAVAASDVDVTMNVVYVNPGTPDLPRGSGILIERAPSLARFDSVVVEGVVGYAIRVRGSSGVRISRSRVRGVLAEGSATGEDGAGVAISGGRGAMISAMTVRTTDGSQVFLGNTADVTLASGTFTGERQLVTLDGVTGMSAVDDNFFDLGRPFDEAYTGTSLVDGRAGLTIRNSAAVKVRRNRFQAPGGVNATMDAIRLDDVRSLFFDSTRVTGGYRAVRSARSSWQLQRSRTDNIGTVIESVDDTVTLTDDTLATAGNACVSARRGMLTLTRLTATQCGVGSAPGIGLVQGSAWLDLVQTSGTNPRAISIDSAAVAIVRRTTVIGPGTTTLGVSGRGGVQLAADSLAIVGSLVSGFPDRAAIHLWGRALRVDSTAANQSGFGLRVAGTPSALLIRDDDFYDADTAAVSMTAGSATNVWWGDGRGPRGTSTATVGDTVIGAVLVAPYRVVPIRPGVTAARMYMLRGDGQSAVVGTSLPLALSVRVTDANGLPVRNIAVKFTLPSTTRNDFNGISKSVNVITNESGIAEVTVRIRERSTFTVTVTAPGVYDVLVFNEQGL